MRKQKEHEEVREQGESKREKERERD